MWEVEYTNEFEAWWDDLSEDDQERIDAAVEMLQQSGPALKRPIVGEIKESRFDPQMKELVPLGTSIRILFIFDPLRTALLLIGGDKAGDWRAWYKRMIPVADKLYEEHLATLRREGKLP